MEILQKFKQNGYYTSELYHLLAKKKLVEPSEEIIPSEYIKQMKMSTAERLQNLNCISIDNIVCGNHLSKVVLSFEPRILVFQNWKPNDKVVTKFTVKNISKSSVFLTMSSKDTSSFTIKSCGPLLSRLAPGMSFTFAVTFMPLQFEDYCHKINFCTELDQYVFPLIGMRPRPLFDFPDKIIIPKVPLKMETHITMTVHNIGIIPASFSLRTSSPFSLEPRSASLNPEQKIDITVKFQTMHLGEMQGVIHATFETGEVFVINVHGSTHTVSIDLEKQVVRFCDTFNTMVRQQTFKIVNKSNHILTYMCMKNEDIAADYADKAHLAIIMYKVKNSESKKNMKLVYYDVLSSVEHERVYTRIFYDEINSLVADESLHYQNAAFSITPIKGNLWPNKATELTITFNPKEVGESSSIAYLDIDGISDRVPLKMIGTSLPPAIYLNVETLDMDCVYINNTYNYEIIAMNKGHINGVIVYKTVPTLFGSAIQCSPEIHCLRPGERETFIISFCNSNQGPFFEEINFIIRDTTVVLKLYLKGEVIYPSLTFSVPSLDFGYVSIGLPKVLELEVINESVVQVNVSVKISSDGPEISSITLADYAVCEEPKPTIPQWPREFDITPSKIVIQPESRVTLKVTLTANLIRANQTYLELELEKSDSSPVTLPVSFNAMVPEITRAPDIQLRGCFIDYSYKQEIRFTANEFRGYYSIQEPEAESPLSVIVDVREGIIEENSTICLLVSITTSVLGHFEYSLRLQLFGLRKPIEVCIISGEGVRPIVMCGPGALHWGQVKLLTKTHKTLTLCNDSPVFVNFKTSLLYRDGRWTISPTEGCLEPESELELQLSLYLLDAAFYTNKAVIQLEKVKDILIPLSATGTGSSILVDGNWDYINLHRHFTKIPIHCKVIMENCGTRLHSLEWSEHYKSPKTMPLATAFFNLEPRVFRLGPGEKMELLITGMSQKACTVKEMWYLVGSVEGINKKELLLECEIEAEFVDPKIEVSTSLIELQFDFGPYSDFYKLQDIVTVKNVSNLPLDTEISIKPPFSIIQKNGSYKIQPQTESMCTCIRYNESDMNVPQIVHAVGKVQSKVFIDYLTLKPVEPNRKTPLQLFQDIDKIKMAFHLTGTIEERLQDQDTIKFQVIFDTTKHLSLKSRIYNDLLRIKFKNHKNKDAIKVVGSINFPNIFISQPRVDFQCILAGSLESKTIKVQNLTPLLVCYRFQWKKCIVTKTQTPSLPKLMTSTMNVTNNDYEPSVSALALNENYDKQSEVNEGIIHEAGKEVSHFERDPTIDSLVFEDMDEDERFNNIRIIKKISPMLDIEYDSGFDWSQKFAKLEEVNRCSINKIFRLVPNRGLLRSNEVQYIQIIFKPYETLNVRALLECEVLGGPSETILVTGQSSDLRYNINTHKLNFKIRSFHQYASQKLIITNTALLPFPYLTYLNEPKFENELDGTIIEIVPPKKVLEPEEEADVLVVVRPGVVGYFSRVFLLEIGHLPYIPIEVFGWGVIPQVYLSLRRPEIVNIDTIIGYQAISTLSTEYLEAVSEFFIKARVSEHLNSPVTERCFDDPEIRNDWHICSTWDKYPTIMDIELAMERLMVINHIKLKPDILTALIKGTKSGPIPGFQTTPYVIDYGVIITGSTVQCTTDVINYGPISTKMMYTKNTILPPWLSVKLCGKLNAGESGQLEVIFSPTSNDFPALEQNVETSFKLEVPYGVTIPIQIKALCAVPYLKSNVTTIDFGSVRCGDKVISSIPLKNVGKPTCIWYVTLKLKVSGPNPLTVLGTSGKYEPGEGGWLSIAFKPTMEMVYEAVLIFRFHMNPNRMMIPVIGRGILPHVHVIGPKVDFSPTLPWSATTDIYFGLTNPCPFPIELIIAHCDKQWEEEDKIHQLLFQYYDQPDEMLLPAIKPGVGLPREIINFHRNFKDTIKKITEDEANSAAKSNRVTVQTKKSKSPKASKSTSHEAPKRRFRSESEIISDEINAMHERGVDPLKQSLHGLEESISSKNSDVKFTKGVLIFVHGSPCEEVQCQEMAYTIGKELGIPTINIDICIIDALCNSDSPAKIAILHSINESYQSAKKAYFKEANEEEAAEIIEEPEDEFDVIWKKVKFICNNKNIGTPRSKTTEKKKKPNSSNGSGMIGTATGGSTTMFQLDFVHDLLTEYFSSHKYHKGFVVDCLTSLIIKNPPLVLTTILKCKPNIWNIHLILCQSDFTKWAQAFEESQRETELVNESEPKVYEEEEILEIVQSFEDMDEEEYENADPDLKAIYVAYGLESRRRKYMNRARSTIFSKKDHKSTKLENSKSVLTACVPDTTKKVKREDPAKGKSTNEYVAMNTRYTEYTKNTYDCLISIANNWIIEEGELGSPLYALNGQLVGTGPKKGKKKSEVQLQTSEVCLTERGFPLTLVTCPCLRYKKALVHMLSTSELVREALQEEEECDILKFPVKRKEYTVLLPKILPVINHAEPLDWRFLDEAPIRKCECNQLTDLNLLDDTNQDNVLNILSKWHCICGKKVASSRTSTTEIPSTTLEKTPSETESEIYPLPLSSVKTLSAPEGRITLQPGDLVRCKYSFSPQYEGSFSVKRFVEVNGWPESRIDINVTGICDIPRLDSRSKKMFEHFVRRTLEDVVYKTTYLDDQKLFEFGPIFIGGKRIYEESYKIDLKNCSLITADVQIEFVEATTVFEIDIDFIRLEPGCRGQVTITAAPAEIGVHRSELLFCVKDNPDIVAITISCSGVVPIVEILPTSKQIVYGKLLLYRKEDDRLIVKNDSILPVMWRIPNAEEFIEDFIIAVTTGVVPGHDNQVVPVTYIACQVGVISRKPLIIEIFDAEGRGDPMVVDTIFLSAECYDVMVDCAYENPNENYLNYGNVKVNSTVAKEMYLLNRGRYNIYYKLKKVKNFPEPSLLKTFTAVPECGLISPSMKLVAIEFECSPTTSMNLVNVPVYICSLLDGSKNQVVVAKFPICITIASFYNTFTLFPLGELNFHIIAIGSGVTRDVILNNTSKCPFTYEIVLPAEYKIDPAATPTPPVSTKTKDTKIRNPPMKCGNFLIMNEDNLLPPGTSRTIQIQFLASAARKFEETIKFVISDTCPAESIGVPLRLVGTGAVPTLDFWNIENTFREHLIMKNMSEYKVPESSPHCVFVEDSVTLHFFSVTVNTLHVGSIDLYNNGLVPCWLSMKLHYQKNSNADIFSLEKYDAHIEPLLHKNLGIIFSPKALEEYRAVLEIKLKLLDNQEKSFKICLIGEGEIPRISMICPVVRQQRLTMLRFPVTCLGSISNRPILFKNISKVKSIVLMDILQSTNEDRPLFWLTLSPSSSESTDAGENYDQTNVSMKIVLEPEKIGTVYAHFNPVKKGRVNCDIKITILENPFEFYTIMCEAEAFMEDVIILGLEMLSMDTDVDTYKSSQDGASSPVSVDSRKKSRSAPLQPKKSKQFDKRSKKSSQPSMKNSDSMSLQSVLKYVLEFGGCELSTIQKRTVIMVNNSEKVYKFVWAEMDYVVIKPSLGYISPSEEKDLEIIFFSTVPLVAKKEIMSCALNAIGDDTLTIDMKGSTWDSRQTITQFDHNQEIYLNERYQTTTEEQAIMNPEDLLGSLTIIILYSATTEYTKYSCSLPEDMNLPDTFIYQTRTFEFKVQNTGNVAMKILWSFHIDDEYPARIDKYIKKNSATGQSSTTSQGTGGGGDGAKPETRNFPEDHEPSKVTLFSESLSRESVDTWFEVDLPFTIEPTKMCLKPKESKVFKVTFAPHEAFDFIVRLRSSIDNLDPYDQNSSCKIAAKSIIPHCHLDIEESDYLTSGRRKVTGIVLPENTVVLEFNVLGSGCYKKSFNIVNPTSISYEFIFEMIMSDKPELIPMHCNKLKGYIESGTSEEVTFTFSPTSPGVYESQWKFLIPIYNLTINLLVVGLVREPEVIFKPTILIIKHSLVGFPTEHNVVLKNCESESLQFEFKGNSLCNESGKTPVIVLPEQGVLKPRSDTPIKIIYTPIQDGPLSFKIFCSITYMKRFLPLCVNALSHSIKPKITYLIIGHEHVLNSETVTNIHLDQTASTYERTITFTIKNDGSATFFFDWHYNSASVKKYLQIHVEPKSGHVNPANKVECVLHFNLKQVPVQAYPITLNISDGPEYSILMHAEIEKPLYHFSCKEFDFGKCIINAPDITYKKNLAFYNDDKEPVTLDLQFNNVPELFIDHHQVSNINPSSRSKIIIFFRPKQVKEYEFHVKLWVNSLCEEDIIIKGEGVPLLFDLYEGCQKSFNLGPVKVGEKIVRQIEVMNHSKVPIEASFIFRDMYPVVGEDGEVASRGTSICLSPTPVNAHSTTDAVSRVHMLQNYKDDKVKQQITMDIENALSSVKVVPNKCIIKPYRKVPLKIQFKPIGLISTLNVQLNMKVFQFERPLVKLSGSATGMSLCFSQNSLQFGRVRKRGCKVLKVMLLNKGDFGARFWWQPLVCDDFKISPMLGHIAAHTNVTFTITYRPVMNNPFVKVWASCNIENYMPLELALYATCVDTGSVLTKSLYLECPVREVQTEYIVLTNPSDEMWLVLSEMSGSTFDTLKEFHVEPNSTFELPINFRPKSIGKHEGQVLLSPLGESAMFVTLVGAAVNPNPNGTINFTVATKEVHTEELSVFNVTEFPETYAVSTEVVRVVPDKFDSFYEIRCPSSVKVWGEAAATCRWTYTCYGECEMHLKVMFVNVVTREYQYYNIVVTVVLSPIVATLTFVSLARETVQKELVIANPLATDADFSVRCASLGCPDLLSISRNSEAKLVLTYSPLVVGETEDLLMVTNELAGSYLYKVLLQCLPAKEKNLEYHCCLGSCIPIRLRVQNKSDYKTHFLVKVSHPSILTEKEYVLGPLDKGKFLVWFEPTELGLQDCRVSFNSSDAGEFVFNISGIATEPKPQGPYKVPAGGSAHIPFKNVFDDTRAFKINIDRQEFYVKNNLETLKSKKDIKIAVYLYEKPPQGWPEVPTGCLTVECEPPNPKVQWTYFLQGI